MLCLPLEGIDAIRAIELPLPADQDAIVTMRRHTIVIVIKETLPAEQKEYIREALTREARESLAQYQHWPLAA